MKKSALFGMAALGMAAVGVTQVFATPTLTVTVGSGSYTYTATSETTLASGTYFDGSGIGGVPSNLNGFKWGGILDRLNSNNQFTVGLGSVTNANSGNVNGTIVFTTSDVVSDPTAVSMQASGTTNATYATSAQTVDFNSSVYSTPTLLASQDSGILGLNSAVSPTSPSSSVAYNSVGANLASFTGSLTVTNMVTLALNPTSSLTWGNLTTNLNNSSVPTPEPATLALFAVGGLALLAGTRRRKNMA